MTTFSITAVAIATIGATPITAVAAKTITRINYSNSSNSNIAETEPYLTNKNI